MVTQQAVETATTQDGDFLTSMRNEVITALPLAGLFEIVPPGPRISGLGGSSLRATGRIDRGNQPAHPCRIGSLCRRASGRSSPAAIRKAVWASALTGAGIEDLPIRAEVGDTRIATGYGARGTCTSKGTGIAVAKAALPGLGTFFADACALRQGCTSSADAKYPPYSRSDGLERLPARGRCRKHFCKYIKLRRVHLLSPPLVNMRAPSRRLGARSRWCYVLLNHRATLDTI